MELTIYSSDFEGRPEYGSWMDFHRPTADLVIGPPGAEVVHRLRVLVRYTVAAPPGVALEPADRPLRLRCRCGGVEVALQASEVLAQALRREFGFCVLAQHFDP